MQEQVPPSVIRERSRRMRRIFKESRRKYAGSFIGHTVNVLWESSPILGKTGWTMTGYSDQNIRVKSTWPERLWNQISQVRVTALEDGFLIGDIQ
jgi:tRNA A37 methylthiotransferase MiaB